MQSGSLEPLLATLERTEISFVTLIHNSLGQKDQFHPKHQCATTIHKASTTCKGIAKTGGAHSYIEGMLPGKVHGGGDAPYLHLYQDGCPGPDPEGKQPACV